MNPDRFRSTPKGQAEHAYADARDLTRAEVRRLTRRITDLIYVEIDRAFLDAIERGVPITAVPDLEEIKKAALGPTLELLGGGDAQGN